MAGRLSICLWSLTASLLIISGGQGATFDNLDSLVTTLFANYKPELRPFVDDQNPTYVYMGIWLAAIQDLDEIDQSLTFSAFLYIEWTDPRLTWSPASYNNTNYFSYPQKNLWIPDITIINSMETMAELGFDRNYLYVIDSGEIVWLPGGIYKTSCDIDITYYPFDTQTCTIIFSTLVSTSKEIDLEADPVYSTHLDIYSPSGTWDLLSFTSHVEGDHGGKTRLGFRVKLRRLTTYYVLAIILPVLFLSLTATLVFALPADSGEKMGTSITVLLAFAVYLTIVSDQMPKTSLTVSVLSAYLTVLLGQTALGVIMSVWILNLHFRDDVKRPPGPRTRTAAFHMQRLMCKIPWQEKVTPADPRRENPKTGDKRNGSVCTLSTMVNSDDHCHPAAVPASPNHPRAHISFSPRHDLDTDPESTPAWSSQTEMMWRDIAYTFDRFLFYTFSIILLVSSVIFLAVLIIGGQA